MVEWLHGYMVTSLEGGALTPALSHRMGEGERRGDKGGDKGEKGFKE
jgi:hypothetical protein